MRGSARKELLQIGDLSRECRKTVRALRYYEELGLLEPLDHTKGGFRLYGRDAVKRIALIEQLQELGFPLERIQVIFTVWRRGQRGEEVAGLLRGFFEEGLKDLSARITRLQKARTDMLDALHFLTACGTCQDVPAADHCGGCQKGDHTGHLPPLMDALAGGR